VSYQSFRVELEPRRFSRMLKLKSGLQIPNPNPPMVEPTPFDRERADEIIRISKRKHRKKGYEWSANISDHMTDGELCFVAIVWDHMRGSSFWMSAFWTIQSEHVRWTWAPDTQTSTGN